MSLSTKIKLFSALGLAVAGLGMAVPTVVKADSSITTHASVGFTENGGNGSEENPVDPEHPDQPGGGNTPGTGNAGPLSLDYVSPFDFGIHTISPKGQTYQSTTDQNTKSATFAQVTDKRAGAPKGWTLKVNETSQLKGVQTKAELTGSVISLGSSTARTSLGTDANKPTVQDIALTPGTQSLVMNANAGVGYGTSVDVWGDSKVSGVTLQVPTGAYPEKDTYTTNLNWSLEDIPGNGNPLSPAQGAEDNGPSGN